MAVWCWCCCYWRADSKTSVLNKVLRKRKCLAAFPNLCCPKRWSGMNRISGPDWEKICVDHNGRIKLRAKQKYEILSATIIYKSSESHLEKNHKVVLRKRYNQKMVFRLLITKWILSKFCSGYVNKLHQVVRLLFWSSGESQVTPVKFTVARSASTN